MPRYPRPGPASLVALVTRRAPARRKSQLFIGDVHLALNADGPSTAQHITDVLREVLIDEGAERIPTLRQVRLTLRVMLRDHTVLAEVRDGEAPRYRLRGWKAGA